MYKTVAYFFQTKPLILCVLVLGMWLLEVVALPRPTYVYVAGMIQSKLQQLLLCHWYHRVDHDDGHDVMDQQCFRYTVTCVKLIVLIDCLVMFKCIPRHHSDRLPCWCWTAAGWLAFQAHVVSVPVPWTMLGPQARTHLGWRWWGDDKFKY